MFKKKKKQIFQREKVAQSMKVIQLYPTLCDPTDYTTVHGILQARILEWVAFPFSRDLPDPRIKPGSPALQADSSPPELMWPKAFIYAINCKNSNIMLIHVLKSNVSISVMCITIENNINES